MLGTAQVEWWKCLLFFLGLFLIDKRAQMGRVSSAHSIQRLYFLLVVLASAAAIALFRSALSNNEIPGKIASWFRELVVLRDPTQVIPLMFQSFQEELLQVVVGERAESIIDEFKRHTLQDQLCIELSKKTEA